MSRMVTGDQTPADDELEQAEQVHIRLKGGDAGTADGPGSPGFVEIEPVTCSCKWATMDTGNSFYSRIVKADPKCKVHPPGWGWGT